MTIKVAHLREGSINFAVFATDARSGLDRDRRELHRAARYVLTSRARRIRIVRHANMRIVRTQRLSFSRAAMGVHDRQQKPAARTDAKTSAHCLPEIRRSDPRAVRTRQA